MRKLLLATTAMAGAVAFGAAAQAQTAPTVRVGGYFDFTFGYVADDLDKRANTIAAVGANPARQVNRNKIDFRSDMEIQVQVRGKAANGLSYGADIELQMDNVTNSGDNASTGNGGIVDIDEVWGFISSPTLGTLQFGDQDSAADQMKVQAPSNLITGFGESGSWDEFIVQSADGTRYLLSTINDGSDASKIIYLSPQFFGFDFGVSYAPNASEGEHFARPNATSGITGPFQRDANATITNEISGAIRYRGSFSNIGVAAGFSAMRAEATENNGVLFNGVATSLQDPTAYQAGLTLTAYGFSVGGHYVWGKYAGDSFGRAPIRSGLSNSSNWTIGGTYTAGPLIVGAFWGQAKRDNGGALPDREQRAWGLGAVYSIAPGLEGYANYTNIKNENIANSTSNPTALQPAGAARDRDLDVFVVGLRLAF